ncbi:hypothetical protein HN018_27585 (plasmid) [Lichenicola cladoniae]|uniref:Uncharacterized protein n=1 Tax=Lichenicola cladoniae TaxID=1484109 RepID=A0A6M8HZW4_9PROT|nr:hypothetical protein [Lichenicola cladoniae]NPD69303.1 hypothetical protein [Acetobacteraceae bacterium]QKE93890.1 hypothetical protein HN018_27585 [Lichenicola cladoniae]
MDRRYDRKINRIRRGDYEVGDFIIADAKDADLSGGVVVTGPTRDALGARTGWRSRPQFLQAIERIVADDVIDIMLLSTSNLQQLDRSGAFDGSDVQPAYRANDPSDVWGGIRGATYCASASSPYQSADLSLTDSLKTLALFSITFNNSLHDDLRSLEAFAAFRSGARASGQRYFLEVFNPNIECGIAPNDISAYVNDCILRTLAGLRSEERPEFLKIVFNGARALDELVHHDPSLIVGILGGGAGTSRDAFELVAQGERYGARVALFGRKINFAEDEVLFIGFLRKVADRVMTPVDAVKGYHDALRHCGRQADRSLDDDLVLSSGPLRQAANQ